jgi:hypothetical protein
MALERIKQIKSLLEESPEDPFLYHAMAMEYLSVSDDKLAEFYFLQAMDKGRDYPAAAYQLGLICYRNQNISMGLSIVEKGIQSALLLGDQKMASELRALHRELSDEADDV